MPRVVDHDARRRQIVASVWSLIGRCGLDAVTMRELAAEAGYANGALSPYFRGKDDILRAAFEYVFDSTAGRARRAIGDRGGMTALRLLCEEIMPLDEVRMTEARVVVAFWDRALHDERMAAAFRDAIGRWREELELYVRQARAAGEAHPVDPDEVVVDTLLTMLIGLQTHALLTPALPATRQRQLLDALLAGLLPETTAGTPADVSAGAVPLGRTSDEPATTGGA